MIDKYAIAGFTNNADLNTDGVTLATKAELKAEQDKIAKLETYDLDHCLGKTFFGDDVSQSMFAHQPAINKLELKTEKGIDFAIGWESKGVYNSKLLWVFYLTKNISQEKKDYNSIAPL